MNLNDLRKFINKRKNLFVFAVLVATTAVTTGFTTNAFPQNMHRVSVSVDGETLTDMTVHMEPEYIFDKLGVVLDPKDTYEVRQINSRRVEIDVKRAVPITISYWGDTQSVKTSSANVAEVMAEYGYHVSELNINHPLEAPIVPNMAIELSDNQAAIEARRAREREQERVSRGIPRYHTQLVMEATAYLPSDGGGSGITATGLVARHGIVAVDPNVIPLGSRVFIPGYGEAIAADTGGAIRGNKIDLCMESYNEAIQFGRRNVEVFVLE